MDSVFAVQAVFSLIDKITGPLRGVQKGLEGAEKASQSLTARMGNLAKAMLPLAAVAGGVMLALAGPVSVAADFEAALSGLGAITQASTQEMAKLEQQARDLGASTAFSASEVVKAQTDLATRGFSTNAIIGAMPGLLNLAAAAQVDLATASEVTAGAINSFNLDASRSGEIADIIADAALGSAASVESLRASLANAGSVAAAAGGDFATVAAMTGKLNDANIDGAVAGTAIKIMYQRLQAPAGAAAQAIKKLGVQTTDAAGNMLPILDVLGQIEKATAGMGGAEKAQYLKNIFGEEAVGSVQAILNKGTAAVGEFADRLRGSAGTAARVAAQQLDNLKGAVSNLSSAWEGVQITVGKVFLPILTKLTNAAARVAGTLDRLAATPVGQALIKVAGVAAAVVVGLAALAGAGAVVGIVMPMITSAAGALLAALAALAWPVALAAALIGVLYVAWKKNLGGIRDVVGRWWNNLQLVFTAVYQLVSTLNGSRGQIDAALHKKLQATGLLGLVTSIGRIVFKLKYYYQSFQVLLQGLGQALEGKLEPALQRELQARGLWRMYTSILKVVDAVESAYDSIRLVVLAIGPAISGNLSPALSKKLEAKGLLGLVTTVAGIVRSLREFFKGLGDSASRVGDTLKVALEPAFNAVKSALAPLGPILQSITGDLGGANAEAGNSFSWQALGSLIGDLAGFVLVTLADILGVIIQVFVAVGQTIGTVVGFLYTLGESIVTGAISNFNGLIAVIGAVAQWFFSLADSIAGGIAVGFNYLIGIVQGVIQWFSSLGESISTAVSGALTGAAAYIQSFDLLTPFTTAVNAAIDWLSAIDLSAIGDKIMSTLAAGIEAAASKVVAKVTGVFDKIKSLLPMSDAKEGPLSALTASGRALIGTIAEGVMGGAGVLKTATAGALSGLTLSAPSLDPITPPVFGAAPVASTGPFRDSRDPAADRESRKIVIQNLTVNLEGVKDGQGFADQLARYVEQFHA